MPNNIHFVKSGNAILQQAFILFVLNFGLNVFLVLQLLGGQAALYLGVFIGNGLVSFLLSLVLVLNALCRLYFSSLQLGIKTRVLFLLFWWVPVLNIFLWHKIYSKTKKEYIFETDKIQLNAQRQALQICRTKYPVLLVHGVFFRDNENFNYWGRIPAQLTQNGATVYYGKQQSAASVASCGQEIAAQIKKIVFETGCEKVNIIAHSKGGLDSRHAISHCMAEDYVASLTTISTPHRGCEFSEYLLEKIPQATVNTVAASYNSTLLKLGDPNPNFTLAVAGLGQAACTSFNAGTQNSPKVYYQSAGSVLIQTKGAKFPLNFSSKLVNIFDGENDGLVSIGSMPWGSRFIKIDSNKKRGISHADVIDLYRENIDNFDVREFYVNMLAELKSMGF